jgi:cytoplasmic iron level regulating protein YaaA (DUF328/UPF0246 family)
MILLLSPSKTQNFDPLSVKLKTSQPVFKHEVHKLVQNLRQLNQSELAELMSISSNLAELNYNRFQSFQEEFTNQNAKPALFAFEGDVYTDIDAYNYNAKELDFANQTIRILSGLYGILQPLDLMQPYRLEMKTKLKTKSSKNLYDFWNTKLTEHLNSEKPNHIINLSSEEYFKAIQPQKINAPILNITFKEKKNNDYKIIAIYAKKARGTMANYIIKNQITNPEKIKDFNLDRYTFNLQLSTPSEMVFTR